MQEDIISALNTFYSPYKNPVFDLKIKDRFNIQSVVNVDLAKIKKSRIPPGCEENCTLGFFCPFAE
jgi:hypothetical protein